MKRRGKSILFLLLLVLLTFALSSSSVKANTKNHDVAEDEEDYEDEDDEEYDDEEYDEEYDDAEDEEDTNDDDSNGGGGYVHRFIDHNNDRPRFGRMTDYEKYTSRRLKIDYSNVDFADDNDPGKMAAHTVDAIAEDMLKDGRLQSLFENAKTAECRHKIATHYGYFIKSLTREVSLPFTDIKYQNTCEETQYWDFNNLPKGIHMGVRYIGVVVRCCCFRVACVCVCVCVRVVLFRFSYSYYYSFTSYDQSKDYSKSDISTSHR